MGSLSQYIEYLNSEYHPSKDDIRTKYTHIRIDDTLKALRYKYRKELKDKEQGKLFNDESFDK